METVFSMGMMLVQIRQTRMNLQMDVRVGNEIPILMGLQMQLTNVLRLLQMNSPIKLDALIVKVREVCLQMKMILPSHNGL